MSLFVSRSAASRDGGGFHVDTVELYNARHRSSYVKQAAEELGCEERVIKRDLGRVLLALEQQSARRREAPTSKAPQTRTPKLTEAEQERGARTAPQRPFADGPHRASIWIACGIVGERSNMLVGYLAAVSRKLDRPLGDRHSVVVGSWESRR